MVIFMNQFGMSSQGLQLLSENVMRVENAVIEQVNVANKRTGYVLISIGNSDHTGQNTLDQIRLNISRNTMIISENGEPMNIDDLTTGMRIDAEFSSAMTRSIPPQTNAYRIIVLANEHEVDITMDRVVSVDTDNGFITTGNPYDINEQIRFNISEDTTIIDENGMNIPISMIEPGKMVYVEHATFQTMSIPPQSPAYFIQVL